MPLELVCNAILLPSLVLVSKCEDGEEFDSMLWVYVDEVAQCPNPISKSGACNVHVSCGIVLNNTSEDDDNAKRVADLPKVSGHETCAKESDEDAKNQFATKKPCKINDFTWKF